MKQSIAWYRYYRAHPRPLERNLASEAQRIGTMVGGVNVSGKGGKVAWRKDHEGYNVRSGTENEERTKRRNTPTCLSYNKTGEANSITDSEMGEG